MGEAVECDVILAGASCRRHTEFWMVNAAASSDGHGCPCRSGPLVGGKKKYYLGGGEGGAPREKVDGM